jgi:hypothetical protein
MPSCSLHDIQCDHISEIARQYEVDKNSAQAELKRLRRKLADVTNDDNGDNNSSHRSQRRKTHHESPPADEEDADIRTDERFVYQAGHKFFLLHAPWVRSGDDLFDTDVDEHYNAAERFENDKNKSQGQLKEILDLLQVKFQQQALRQRWLRRQVISIHILQHGTHL